MVVPSVVEQITMTALESAFDLDHSIGIRACHRPAAGSVADTFVLELETGGANGDPPQSGSLPARVICKLGGASVWTEDVIEPFVVERVSESTTLPVPAVLASGSIVSAADGPDDGTDEQEKAESGDRWALYEFSQGQNPGSDSTYRTVEPAVRHRLVAEAGACLGQLHALAGTSPELAFDRVGGLARCSDGLAWRELEGWHALDPDSRLLRSALSVPLAGDDGCRPVLTHGDYQPSNLLVTPAGEITAILDWGNAHVTHAGYALARAEARFVDLHARQFSRPERSRLRRTFRREYARHAPLPDEFSSRAPIYKLLWVCQSGVNYTQIARSARGRRQLWRQCRRLLG